MAKKAAEAPAPPEARRFTIKEALAEAATRRDARMGRKPVEELKASAADRANAVGAELSKDQYEDMAYGDLQQAAKDRELSAGGSAEDLKARLREADKA